MGWEQYHQNVQYRIMYSKNFSMPDIIVISTAQSQEKSEEKLSSKSGKSIGILCLMRF